MQRLIFLICAFTSVAAAQSAPSKKDIPAIAKEANGAIVSIVMLDKDHKPIAQGSGFFVSKDGLVLTNHHVISEGSSAIVTLPDGAFYVVKGVLTFDKTRDIAIIKVNDPFADAIPASPHAQNFNFLTLTLGNSDRVQVGEEVVAIGNPLSLESTVSNGIVSGIRTADELGGKFLQITAPISPGSSGGPLFNMAGEVVGITTMHIRGGENLNFAIPINDAKRILADANSMNGWVEVLPIEPPKETPSRATPSAPIIADPNTAPNAHSYYQQLFDAGAFDTNSYVCFSDDTQQSTFFTFLAAANAVTQEPYILFFSNDMLKTSSKSFQKLFRHGGRILQETVYEKGVKSQTLEYHWDGSSWVLQIPPTDPNAYTRESRILHLSIEPTTMRYIESATVTTTVGWGGTASTGAENYGPWAGVCEKVPKPPK